MLEIKNLELKYGDKIILENINLKVKKGEILVLTGNSGSGKSTLLKVLNGIIPEINEADISGEIILEGKPILKEDISNRSRFVSTVFQNPKTQFYCVDSTDEIAFALENRNIPKDDMIKIIDEYTSLLNTKHLMNKNIFSLSGGEKQLIAITSVACMNNEVYIFDEPSSSLDKKSIELLKGAMIKLKNAGKIIIVAEHRLYYLKDVMNKIAILDKRNVKVFEKEMITEKFLHQLIKKYNLRTMNEIDIDDLKKIGVSRVDLYEKENNKMNLKQKDIVLECKNFEVSYANKKVFNMNIYFSNDIYFIIGENGVGKSTFIKKLSKLVKGKGESFYKGKKIHKPYKFISMVMQDVNYQIFTESVWQEISIVSNDDIKKKKVLEELDLYDKRDMHPQVLSGGEKQRLMIALAKVCNKPIVIFDEPTSGLCKKQMLQMVRYLRQMKEDGKVIIVITHDYELINKCSGRIYEFVKQEV